MAVRRILAKGPSATTGSDGQFVCRLINEGLYNLEAVSSDMQKAWPGNGRHADETRQVGSMALKATGTLIGRVAAPEQPTVTDFEGVVVFIPGSSYAARADRAGNWTMSGVSEGRFDRVAMKDGLGRAAISDIAVASDEVTRAGTPGLLLSVPMISGLSQECGARGFPRSLGLAPDGKILDDDGVLAGVKLRLTEGDGPSTRLSLGQRTSAPTYANGPVEQATWPGLVTTTFAGIGPEAAPDEQPSSRDGMGTEARFTALAAMAKGPDGVLYVTEGGSYPEANAGAGFRVRKVTPDGNVTILAGGTQGFVDGRGAAAAFGDLAGIAVDSHDNVYVSDSENFAIRENAPDGTVQTLIGSTQEIRFPADGKGLAARIQFPGTQAFNDKDDPYVLQQPVGKLCKVE
jgi:hypothetical protein